jgi:hypothetical protein
LHGLDLIAKMTRSFSNSVSNEAVTAIEWRNEDMFPVSDRCTTRVAKKHMGSHHQTIYKSEATTAIV